MQSIQWFIQPISNVGNFFNFLTRRHETLYEPMTDTGIVRELIPCSCDEMLDVYRRNGQDGPPSMFRVFKSVDDGPIVLVPRPEAKATFSNLHLRLSA